jgi:hypothetical protein
MTTLLSMASVDPKDELVKLLLEKENARLESRKAWHNKKYNEDPAWRDKKLEASRQNYQKKKAADPSPSKENVVPTDPKVLARRAAARERYKNDPEFREKQKEAMRKYHAAKRESDNPGKRAGPGRPRQSEALAAAAGVK